jgi:hypothetical protein
MIAPTDDDCVAADVDVVADTAFAGDGANEKREEIYRDICRYRYR